MKEKFLRFDLKQTVNQWLSIALICIMCFWVMLYYFVNKTISIGTNLAAHASAAQNPLND